MIINVSDNKKKNIVFSMLVVVAGMLFFFGLGSQGYILDKDSNTFIEWSYSEISGGYRLYPFLLKVFRSVFGEEYYLDIMCFLQNVLSLVSTYLLTVYIAKEYKLGYVGSMAAFLAILGMYGYSLPEAVSSHYILTEGLTYPVFIVLVRFFLDYINSHKLTCLLLTSVFGIILIITRPQLLVLIPVLGTVLILDLISRKANKDIKDKAVYLMPVVAIVTAFMAVFATTILATVAFSDSMGNNQFHQAIAGKALCLITEEDRDMFNGDAAEVFEVLYEDGCSEKKISAYFPESILEYEAVQRAIDKNVSQSQELIWKWLKEKNGETDRVYACSLRNEIILHEVTRHRWEFSKIVLRLIPSSLVSSIFIQPQRFRLICNILALIIYAVSIAFFYYAYRIGVDGKYLLPMVLTYTLIYFNALLSNIILYGQQRYVVYSFGLFYVSLILLIKSVYIHRREVINNESV